MLLPRANEAARAGSIAAAARRRIGTIATAAPRAASALLSSSQSSSPSSFVHKSSSLTPICNNTMTKVSSSPGVAAAAPQSPINRPPNNATGLWNPSRGIHFAAGPAVGAETTSGSAGALPATLVAHTTPKFKRRRRVDISSSKSALAGPPLSGTNQFQTSSRNAAPAEEEEKAGEYDQVDFPPVQAQYRYSDGNEFGNRELQEDEKERLGKTASLDAFYGTDGEKSEFIYGSEVNKEPYWVEPREYNEKVWLAGQEAKRAWEKKTKAKNTAGERALVIEDILIPDGKVDFWDIVNPFDKAVKMYALNGRYASTYKDMAMAKHKRDARVQDVDKVQIPMLEQQPDVRLLEDYFSLRSTAFEIYVAYALAGPLEIRKLFELMMVEKRLLKVTSTMQREIVNKRYLRDEQILGLGTKVNIPGIFRVPKNYSLTNADAEVVNNAFEKSPLHAYHATGAANPWDRGDGNQKPGIFVPPVRFPDEEDIGVEAQRPGRSRGDPRTRLHRRKIQRAMFWAQRYGELAWRAQRMRLGKEPGGGTTWSKKEFTIEDVDKIMGKFNLKPTGAYTFEDILTRSLENSTQIGKATWDEERMTWDSLPNARLSFDDLRQLPDTAALYPDHRYRGKKDEKVSTDLVADLEEGILMLDTLDNDGQHDIWSEEDPEAKGERSDSENETIDIAELFKKEEEEVVEDVSEAEAVKVPKRKKRATISVKLAAKDEPPYVEPSYFLDSMLIAKHAKKDKSPYFSYRLYSKSSSHKSDYSSPVMRYCETVAQMDNAMGMFKDCKVLGFDMEWAAFGVSKNPKYNVSLIQVASHEHIVLFHLAMMSKFDFPARLKEVLEDETVIKTGVAIKGDATRLLKHWKVRANGLIDLGTYHKLLEDGSENELARPSLAALTEFYTNLGLSKDPKIRRSHWERALTMDQRLYAANDAYACVRIFDEMDRQRHEMKPRPARPDCFQAELPEENGSKPKKSVTKKLIADEVLEAISQAPDPLAALKEHQEKEATKARRSTGSEKDKALEEESSGDNSDDSFERLPTPESSSASEEEDFPVPPTRRTSRTVKKTATRETSSMTKRTVMKDISGKREFSTSSSSTVTQGYGAMIIKKDTIRWNPAGVQQTQEKDIVPGNPEFMETAFQHQTGGKKMEIIRERSLTPRRAEEAPTMVRSSEIKFEDSPMPIRIISRKKANPPPPKYQLKGISKEPDHEDPNNGPIIAGLRKPIVIRRVYPPELKLAQKWANFVINNEQVPRRERGQKNPGGSGNQLAIYHLWHIQGFPIQQVREILSAFNEVKEDAVHQRLCQAIALFPVSYDRIRLKKEVFDNASHKTKQDAFYIATQKIYEDDAAGIEQRLEPTWLNKNATTVHKDYQVGTTVGRDPKEP